MPPVYRNKSGAASRYLTVRTIGGTAFKTTGEQTSLKTHDKMEAQRLLQAQNDAQR
jgi:hypothetical protein